MHLTGSSCTHRRPAGVSGTPGAPIPTAPSAGDLPFLARLMQFPRVVVPHRGSRISVRGGLLHVAQRNPRIKRRGDERVPERTKRPGPAGTCPAGDLADNPDRRRAGPAADRTRPGTPARWCAHRWPGRTGRHRDGDHLAALAGDRQVRRPPGPGVRCRRRWPRIPVSARCGQVQLFMMRSWRRVHRPSAAAVAVQHVCGRISRSVRLSDGGSAHKPLCRPPVLDCGRQQPQPDVCGYWPLRLESIKTSNMIVSIV